MLALLALLSPAHAWQPGLHGGVSAGWFWYLPDGHLEDTWTVVPRLGYRFTDRLGVELDAGFMNGLTPLDKSYWALTPRLNVTYSLWQDGPVEPFVAAGPGLVRTDINRDFSEDQPGSQGSGNQQALDTDFALNAGPGLLIPLASWLDLRTDLRWLVNVGSEPMGVDGNDLYSDIEWTLGIDLHAGAPASDTDGDGLLDEDDACVTEPEDEDGFRDEDGCPDTDNDGDGLLDTADRCPDEAEDVDDFEDADGCPDNDNDNDGILDRADACPVDAGVPEHEGCPDRDGDGFVDASDSCPDTVGVAPDGCPAAVKLEADRVVILEQVHFDTNKATIQPVSHQLLTNVAEVLRTTPRITLVEVAGHTDSQGADDFNLDLSQRRAEAVLAYLVDQGVEPQRLQAKGYGETRPIETNDTAEGRSANRRVEFDIIEQGATD